MNTTINTASLTNEWLIELHNITASYGTKPILHDVTVQINEGEIIAILGPNGSGKSTVLKSMFGLTQIESGNVMYLDQKINPVAHELVKMGVAFVPQGRRVFTHLSVHENLEIGGFFLNDSAEVKRRIGEIYKLFPMLHEKRKEKSSSLSGGQQQILAIARGLMVEPKVLMLDEPTLGLSPKAVLEIFALIKKINQERKMAIVIVEHNLRSLLPITDRVYVINHGTIAFHGKPETLEKENILERVYMGKM
jgi:branched-chain amino acid transport system ATP-binding protein